MAPPSPLPAACSTSGPRSSFVNIPSLSALASQASATLSALTCLPITWLDDGHLRIGTHTFPLCEHLHTSENNIFLATYLSPSQALALRQQGRYYLDTAGNAFVQAAGICLFIEGQTLTPASPATPPPTGLRLLYYLLSEPHLLKAPYRTISQRVGVALGSVSAFFTELRQQGLFHESPRTLNLNALLARWVQDYSDVLRPSLNARRYRWATAPGIRWAQLPMVTGAYWGGEPAARLLLQEKRSSLTSFTLYSPCLPNWGLIPDPSTGPVEILAPPFPLPELAGTRGIAHPLLVYTDLLRSSRAFDQELAQQLQTHHLTHLL